ncbi:hypothetical protein EDB89DRAFT_1915068 [Lactarius sanguifluus]|nr:hypothetical protein EDB89DRAFT_1915068 [Lactarius sanguifluus]
MPPSKARLNAAARARAGRQRQRQTILLSSSEQASESENDSESSRLGEEDNSGTDGIEELAGPDLTQSLERKMEREAEAVRQMTLFDKITHSEDNWKRAESRIRGYYTGNSERTQRREKRRLNAKAESDDKTHKRHGHITFCNMFIGLMCEYTFPVHLQRCSEVTLLLVAHHPSCLTPPPPLSTHTAPRTLPIPLAPAISTTPLIPGLPAPRMSWVPWMASPSVSRDILLPPPISLKPDRLVHKPRP